MDLSESERSRARPEAPALPVKVLVVDDDRVNLLFLRSLLGKMGYTVVEARDGVEAVQVFGDERPDIVFMDVMMPRMNGYEATRRIKALAGERFVPVIFLTALTDDAALTECIEVGGDDFLTKPFRQAILKSKLVASERIRALYGRVQRQNEELRVLHARRSRDDEIAQRVFADALAANSGVLAGVNSLMQPAAAFNGDLLLAANRPGGGLHLMLGDFTGHGLAAAIWALPVSEVFHAMTAKGFGLNDIVVQINRKLFGLSPKDIFLSACLVALDRSLREAEIWNGGMPDVLIVDGATGRIRTRLASHHLPLGIASEVPGAECLEHIALTRGDRLVMYSDGLIEARNPEGEEFGDGRLCAAIENGPANDAFARIREALETFTGRRPQDDDVSLVDILCEPAVVAAGEQPTDRTAPQQVVKGSAGAGQLWRWSLELHAPALGNVDPVPIAMHQLAELPGLSGRQSELYTVLAELYSNALYHGVLRLDSALKNSAEGFDLYYRVRDERLAALSAGWVRLELELVEPAPRGRLRIRIVDSGEGFDPTPYINAAHGPAVLAGRGIALVRQLCESLDYKARGNAVEAVYVWSA